MLCRVRFVKVGVLRSCNVVVNVWVLFCVMWWMMWNGLVVGLLFGVCGCEWCEVCLVWCMKVVCSCFCLLKC